MATRTPILRPEYYQHSGRFEPIPLGLAAAGACAAAALLAVVYAYLLVYIPIGGYISFIFTASFGMGMGIVTGMLLRMKKVRSLLVANLVAAGVAFFGLYVAWAVWCYALLTQAEAEDVTLLPILFNPLLLGELIFAINKVGAWSIKNFTPTGFGLALLWLVEALIVFIAATLSGVSAISSAVFCEACGEWCDETKGVARLGAQTPTYVRRRLEERDFPFLAKLGTAGANATEFFRVDVYSCLSCGATHAMSMQHVVITHDKDGKEKEETTAVVDKLVISAEESQWLRAFGAGEDLPPLVDEPAEEATPGRAPAPARASAPASAPAPAPASTPTRSTAAASSAPRPSPSPAAPSANPAQAEARRRLEISSVAGGGGSSIERVNSAIRPGFRATGGSGPRDASEALRFAAFRAQPRETGVLSNARAGTMRDLPWASILQIVVMQLPNDPPWASAIVVDLVPVDRGAPVRLVTGSFIDWKALPGEPTTSPHENVRRLCRFALERNPQIVIDDATRAFTYDGQPCPRILGMRVFAEYDARYG